MKAQRPPVHPVVARYIETDQPLTEIIRSVPGKPEPVLLALQYIQECLGRRRLAKQAFEAAEAVRFDEADTDLLVMMLSLWAELASRVGRQTDAEALIQRARVLVSDRAPREVRAAAIFAESVLDARTGRRNRAEGRLKEILTLLPAASPRLKFFVWELGLFLAQQGRANEFDTRLRWLEQQQNENFTADRLLLLQFVDAVETGRVADALQLDAQLAHEPRLADNPAAGQHVGYRALLRLMAERNHAEPLASVPPATAVPPTAMPPVWIEIVRCLLRGQTTDALRFARREADRLVSPFLGTGFDSLNLVRAELASGNAEAARRLMELRRERGNTHYLDNLFLARVDRLAGNQPAAARRFVETLESADRYRAHGRVDFELRLACEMSHGDLIALTRHGAAAGRPPAASRAAPRPAPPQPAGEPAESAVDRIIGRNPAIVALREMIHRLADADAPVLITGETGTGKELVARALHAVSRRRDEPFVAVNCGSIAESLLDSELFGHRRGAFTGADRANRGLFEEAGGGTILLDEMGEILPRLQQALLRVLETGEIRAVGSSQTRRIRCRILAATNADVGRLAAEGRFRKDLLYRLQRLGIELPPLRERRDDVVTLARHFLDAGRAAGVHATVAPELARALEAYDWPGNVRELRNVIERMRLMHSDKLAYGLDDLDIKFQGVNAGGNNTPTRIPLPTQWLGRESAVRRAAEPGGRASERVPLPADAARLGGQPPALPEANDATDRLIASGRSELRRLDRLRELFLRYTRLTRSEMARITGVSLNTATKDLRTLCDAGFIERVTPSASTRSHFFRLKPPAAKRE